MASGHSQPASELTIWGRLNAYNVPKVVWAAEELGLTYRRVDAGRSYGIVGTPDYLAMNPNGRVPTIQDGDFILWESNVIVRYLCGRYGLGGMCPDELQARMEAEKWMDWEATNLFRAFLHAQSVVDQTAYAFTIEQTAAALAYTVKVLGVLNERLAEPLCRGRRVHHGRHPDCGPGGPRDPRRGRHGGGAECRPLAQLAHNATRDAQGDGGAVVKGGLSRRAWRCADPSSQELSTAWPFGRRERDARGASCAKSSARRAHPERMFDSQTL